MKRGQSPVVPFFRGGEGDGTFNGFVLSSLNLSFVKDTYVNAKKMARKVGKMVIYESQILGLTLYQKFRRQLENGVPILN